MNIPGPTPAQRARFAETLDALAPPLVGPIILAVSGGPDSLALLLLAASVRHGAVIAATVDHRLRPENMQEAKMVQDICKRYGVHHAIHVVKVADDPAGVQASARDARYKALAAYAQRKGAPFLATAHHVDDQAETVLMRLARGAGVTGLAGVRDKRPFDATTTVIRPLLGWRRSELAAIVAAGRLEAVDDPSNRDARYDRTRVRAMLAQGWPDPLRLAAVGRHMADADEALDWVTAGLFPERFARAGDDGTLDTQGLPREIARRAVLAAMAAMAPEDAVPRGDELIRLLDRLEAGHVSTLGSLRIAPGAPWRFTRTPPHRSD